MARAVAKREIAGVAREVGRPTVGERRHGLAARGATRPVPSEHPRHVVVERRMIRGWKPARPVVDSRLARRRRVRARARGVERQDASSTLEEGLPAVRQRRIRVATAVQRTRAVPGHFACDVIVVRWMVRRFDPGRAVRDPSRARSSAPCPTAARSARPTAAASSRTAGAPTTRAAAARSPNTGSAGARSTSAAGARSTCAARARSARARSTRSRAWNAAIGIATATRARQPEVGCEQRTQEKHRRSSRVPAHAHRLAVFVPGRAAAARGTFSP